MDSSQIKIISPRWEEYELIDSGNGEKLERYGPYIIRRPEGQALWKRSLPNAVWEKTDAHYIKSGEKFGEWKTNNTMPPQWKLPHQELNFFLKLTPFGHVGVFPEQQEQWTWVQNKIRLAGRTIKILNLFSYTGALTLAAAAAGASVTHVDASKPSVAWARENQTLSNLSHKPIRWIIEDALKFVKREVRRESTYDAVIVDPPKFGRGPKGEVWKFEDHFSELLQECKKILNPNPIFFLITAYAIPVSSLTLHNMLQDTLEPFRGTFEYGELALREEKSKRLLQTALFSRWERK